MAIKMTASESFARNYAHKMEQLTHIGSEPTFQLINPFGLGHTFLDGENWRVVCPRCNGEGEIMRDWAIENKYAPRQGTNCFLCTRSNQKTGWHRLPSMRMMEQLLLQAIFLIAHCKDWNPSEYLIVVKRGLKLRFKPSDNTPFQNECFEMYSFYLNLLENMDEEEGIEAVLPDHPAVYSAARWYDSSIRKMDAATGLKGLIGYDLEAHLKSSRHEF